MRCQFREGAIGGWQSPLQMPFLLDDFVEESDWEGENYLFEKRDHVVLVVS